VLLRPWALWRLDDFSPLDLVWSSGLVWSSDLLKSLLWPEAVVFKSDEGLWAVVAEPPLWSGVAEDELLSPFILALSDFVSVVVVVVLEPGVELELVSWLCARAPKDASARARADNAMNLIETSTWLVCAPNTGDYARSGQRTTPR
jgi:hypothetical protein